MAQYTYKVELETNTGFILDTDVLDTGVLGYLLQDVTQYVRSIRTRRGKSTLQGKFTAGQMTVVFDNRTRAFDPKYTSSPYYGSIVPRRRILFTMWETTLSRYPETMFTGWVDDWNLSYDVSGDSTSTAQCSDAFTVLSAQNINISPPAELSVDRFRRVLTSPGVQWSTDLMGYGSGGFTLGTAAYSGNVLDYLQSIADSEAGYLFVNKIGVVTFYNWNDMTQINSNQGQGSFISTPSNNVTDAIPVTSLEIVYGTEELVNNATITSYAGTVTVQDTTSQQAYGIASESYPVLTSTVGEMTTLANFYITNYANPRYRVSQIQVSLDDPRLKNFNSSSNSYKSIRGVLMLDIGQKVYVFWAPNNIGSRIEQGSQIIGFDIDATPESCTFTYSIAGEDTRSYV